MKILIFNWRDLRHSWAGGGEIYVFEQASRWVKAGHIVTVFCGQDTSKNLPEFERVNNIAIYRKGGRYSLYFWAIWYYLTRFRNRFDVVIDVENGIPFFTPLFCTLPKVCYVYHVHGRQFFYELPFPFSYVGYFIEKYIFPLVYRHVRIVAISQTTKKQLTLLGFHAKNISILYSGINGTKAIKKSKKFSHPTILYLGRIKKYKRVDLLITIFPEILKKIPNARLIIAGWGTEASILIDKVMQSPFRKKISLVGPVSNEEKKSLLSKAWIFVNPSIGEGWSIAVIEANLHGTPAIAFDVAGLRESIKHQKTGLLAKNQQDFIATIATTLTHKALRERLSRNAITWAHSFNWDYSAKKGFHILKKVSHFN